jgi:hypothetical protein
MTTAIRYHQPYLCRVVLQQILALIVEGTGVFFGGATGLAAHG